MKIIVRSAVKFPDALRPKRVAAYCRVSTEQEIQFHSLKMQQDYYKKRISEERNWTFAGVYAD